MIAHHCGYHREGIEDARISVEDLHTAEQIFHTFAEIKVW